jgi:hypothetical protein
MNPIFNRSSFYYWTSLGTYAALMGRYLVTRDWSAFEIIPLFMPVWLASAMLAGEHDESYAFLRTLAVTDRAIVRTKFGAILLSAAMQWALMVGVSIVRRHDAASDPSTVVYLTLIASAALILVGWLQVGIWRHGMPVMLRVTVGAIAGGIVLIILHMVCLKQVEAWPALSRIWLVQWLGGSPWVSSAVLAAAALAVFHRLMGRGVRMKTSSEACL